MTPEESYREYLTRTWIVARVAEVKKHKSSKWERFKRWIERKFTK